MSRQEEWREGGTSGRRKGGKEGLQALPHTEGKGMVQGGERGWGCN